MKKKDSKRGAKITVFWIGISLMLVVFIVLVTTRPVIDSQENNGRLSPGEVLQDIHTNMLAYRIAEMERLLSSEKEMKTEYENRLRTILQQLKRNQVALETLLFSKEEKEAYETFKSAWNAYLQESKRSVALSDAGFSQQALTELSQKLRRLFEKSDQTLSMVIEANTRYANSWSGYMAELYRKNRLNLSLVYICGVTVLLILVFNLYDKVKKRCS